MSGRKKRATRTFRIDAHENFLRRTALERLGEADFDCLLKVMALGRATGEASTVSDLIDEKPSRRHPIVNHLADELGRHETVHDSHPLPNAEEHDGAGNASGSTSRRDPERNSPSSDVLYPGDWILWGDGGYFTPFVVEDPAGAARLKGVFKAAAKILPRKAHLLQGNQAAAMLLNAIAGNPSLETVSGDAQGVRGAPARLAVTGTRNPTQRGVELARRLGDKCATEGVVGVHGGAIGVDTAFSRGLNAPNLTSPPPKSPGAVTHLPSHEAIILGQGISHARRRHPLRRYFNASAVLTLSPPDAAPSPPALIARNELIARLGEALLVGQVRGVKGGVWRTLEFSKNAGRLRYCFPANQLFATPPRPDEESFRRAHHLLETEGVGELADDWFDRNLQSLIQNNVVSTPDIPREFPEKQDDLFE